MFAKINNKEFKSVMSRLYGKSVWVKVWTECVVVDLFYEEFEFISFVSGKWQFGHMIFDDETAYQNIIIEEIDIDSIHRDGSLGECQEYVVINLVDGTRIFVEWNY